MNIENKENIMKLKDTRKQCPNCPNMCFGKQCSDCHKKMIERTQGSCMDCEKLFYALRQDGTKRKRCKECQEDYNQKHISICAVCKNTYHAVLNDGRKFDKCYKCYQDSINKCEKCDKNAYGQKYCRECYQNERQNKHEIIRVEKKCKSDNCSILTTYTYCKTCNDNLRSVSDQYIISRCEMCGYRGRGDFKICNYCC